MRLVHEAREEDPELSMHQAVQRIGSRVGVNTDTLRGWCKQADIDAGKRPGTTSGDAQKIKQLEAEVRELKRANEILWRLRVSSRGSSTRDCRGDHLH
jgi:transposase